MVNGTIEPRARGMLDQTDCVTWRAGGELDAATAENGERIKSPRRHLAYLRAVQAKVSR